MNDQQILTRIIDEMKLKNPDMPIAFQTKGWFESSNLNMPSVRICIKQHKYVDEDCMVINLTPEFYKDIDAIAHSHGIHLKWNNMMSIFWVGVEYKAEEAQ